jgi:hypothetical protein
MVLIKRSRLTFAYLLVGHTTETHFEHVQVVPTAREAAVNIRRDFVDDGKNRAMRARSDAVRICGIAARTKIIWSGEGVVDIARDAP